MNARVDKKERSREAILDSAVRLLRERGIFAARVADVMEGAGLTVGGFYAHFGSKEELVDEALRRTAATLCEKLFERIEEKPEEDRAEVVLKRYLSSAHRDAHTLGCPLPAIAGEIGTRAPEHRKVIAEQIDALAVRLEALLPKGSSRRTVALGMIALMYGGLGLSRALAGTPLSDEVLRACRAIGKTTLEKIREENP